MQVLERVLERAREHEDRWQMARVQCEIARTALVAADETRATAVEEARTLIREMSIFGEALWEEYGESLERLDG